MNVSIVRMGMPLDIFEPHNDNDQSDHFLWDGFKDTGARTASSCCCRK